MASSCNANGGFEDKSTLVAILRHAVGVRVRQLSIAGVLMAGCSALPAQSQDHDIDAWPSVDVWVKLDPLTRLYFMGSISSDKFGGTRERSFGTAIDRKLSSKWSVRGGLREVVSSSEFQDTREHRAILDMSYARDIPHGWKISNRNRVDMRWVEGKSYSSRARERIMLERTSRAFESVTWYGSHELYYDDRYDKISRTRSILGASWRLSGHVSLDAYGARQWDLVPERSRSTEVGFVLGLYFDAASTVVTGVSE